jgi:D-Tyr-tRNA(Tyr) deacylase
MSGEGERSLRKVSVVKGDYAWCYGRWHLVNRSVIEIGGQVLVVSQLTLYADVRRGVAPASPTPHHPQ